jgi:D-alanine--poly(phosphoribitol) ligase subunit 1
MNWNLAYPVFEQSARTPQRLALAADGVERTYVELVQRARRLAGALRAHGIARGSHVGILGSRSLIAVEAVLGVVWAGAAYVPLGLRWPEERLRSVLALDRLDALIVDERGVELLTPAVLAGTKLLVLPSDGAVATRPSTPGKVTLSLESLADPDRFPEPVPMAPDDLAYIIFTSGTTGVPKGVMTPVRCVAAYLAALGARKAMTPDDRASQFTELTFDPSIGEILLPWHAGASLHVVPAVSQVSPARFIRDRQLTIWGSAPAAIAWMRDTRSLQPGSLPGLRYSSFGGEPLSLAAVRAWQAAAPNSVVDNLYGPTEATVDCAGQRVEPGATPVVTPGRGILAIGTPHPGTELAVLGADRRALPAGETGELAIAGAQLGLGYLDAPALTAERFPVIGGKRWYLTGDIAMHDAAGVFHHLGRIDNQIKIHGHRVELEDVEAHTRFVAHTDQVAAVAWPMEDGVAQAIVCFVAQSKLSPNLIREALRRRLPSHMVPAGIHDIAALPLNASGKLDRRALIARLEAERERGRR